MLLALQRAWKYLVPGCATECVSACRLLHTQDLWQAVAGSWDGWAGTPATWW